MAKEATEVKVPEGSFTRAIMKQMMDLDRVIQNPDAKHNQGKLIGEAYLWRAVQKYAELRYGVLMAQEEKKVGSLITMGIVTSKDKLTPGEHSIAESPSFVVTAKVSQPVERFDPLTLATEMSKVFKKPLSSCVNMINDAKKAGKSTVTYTIAERV